MKHLNKLKALNLPEDQFAIFGSGPMIARGIRENSDIDIIVKESLWKKLREEHNTKIKNEGKTECIEIGEIEIFHDWNPWFDNVDELIDTADVIDNLRFVKLEHVLTWKKSMGRDKDLRDIQLIEDYIATMVAKKLAQKRLNRQKRREKM